MAPHLLLFSIEAIGLFSIVLLGLRVFLAAPAARSAQILALICFNCACARLLAWHEYGFWIPDAYDIDVGLLAAPMNIARNLTPGLFMVLCHSLFRERSPFPRWLAAAFIVQILMESPLPSLFGVESRAQTHPFELMPAFLQLLFLGCGLFWIVSGWAADLVEDRRKLRWLFLLVVGSYVLATVLLQRLLIPWDTVLSFHTYVALSSFGATLSVLALVAMLRSDATFYLDPFRPARDGHAERTFARIELETAALQRALCVQRIYRDGELTIASLAASLGMPEYRLRKLIHETLGYRNFNSMLHEHRIREACELLADETRRTVPILTIALSLGYNSINPFNRAFRQLRGTTPSAFRAEARRDPGARS